MKTLINQPWGDTIDTVKHSKPLDQWYYSFPKLNYNVFRLPTEYSFDIEEMRKQIDNILESHEPLSIKRNSDGKKYNRYKGLGFFAREDSVNPLEDHFTRRDTNLGEVFPDDLHLNNSLPELYENDFTKPTQIYNDYFKDVFSVFKHHINKASLLDMRSKGFLGSHVDFPYYKAIRLHATIYGGEHSYYEVDGERFQIPADGHWYFFDTGKYHSAWNEGPQDRLTINVNLSGIFSDPRELADKLAL